MIKQYTNYTVDNDVIMPYGKPLYRGDKITVISIDEVNDKVKIMKTGDYDRGWWTYLSSFNMIFRKVEYKYDDVEEYFMRRR